MLGFPYMLLEAANICVLQRHTAYIAMMGSRNKMSMMMETIINKGPKC